ncbi:hypothetical protein ACXPWS_18205 [Mycobacterium sp. BMJ-28]
MTALQDWLAISPVTPQSVKSLVWGALRAGAPGLGGTPAPRHKPKAMRRGVERC